MDVASTPRIFTALALACAGTTAPAQTTFTQRDLSTVALQPTSVVVADVDGDGDNDVVAAEYTANAVVWYQNSGASPPTWTKRVIDGGAAGPITVAVGDVGGDGDIDVFSANFNDEGISFYESNGAALPSWTKQVISAFWTGPWGVHAADVDGDGDIDGIGGLTNVICGPPLDCRGVEWYDNDGGTPPSFTTRAVSPGLLGASSVHAVDVDGDDDTDILSVDTAGDRVLCYENDGAHPPGWTERVVTTATDDPWAVFAADLDRDGDTDVIVASAEDDRVSWHENDGASPPGWTSRTIANGRDGALSVHAADLDGDGDTDVIAGSWNDSTLAWYESDGGAPPAFVEHFIAICGGPEGIFAARVDGDADADVLCAANPGFRIHFFENNANYAEADGDGVRDDLDCAPSDPAAFAVPGEVRAVRFRTRTELRWGPAGLGAGVGTVHDVMRGSLAELPVGSGPGEECLADGTADTTLAEESEPDPGEGFYYLVRASNACGVGNWGFESSGAEQTSAVCD